MPGSRWVSISLGLSGSLGSFCKILLCILATYFTMLLITPMLFCSIPLYLDRLYPSLSLTHIWVLREDSTQASFLWEAFHVHPLITHAGLGILFCAPITSHAYLLPENTCREFPGSPVIRTLHFTAKGPSSISGQGTKLPLKRGKKGKEICVYVNYLQLPHNVPQNLMGSKNSHFICSKCCGSSF